MRTFVSYARRDNDRRALLRVQNVLCTFGDVYIDDLHNHGQHGDRSATVRGALLGADAFVAIVSEHYLLTPWTLWEFLVACGRGIPISLATVEALAPNPSRTLVWGCGERP